MNQLDSTLESSRIAPLMRSRPCSTGSRSERVSGSSSPAAAPEAPWLLLVLVAAVAGVVWWQARSRRATADAEFDEVTGRCLVPQRLNRSWSPGRLGRPQPG